MKDYIFNRIKQSEALIKDELYWCTKCRKAKDVDFKAIRERVMSPVMIKTMPAKYREQISAILWFCFEREVSRYYLFPVIFEGKLYSKWDNMPEGCKQMLMTDDGNHGMSYRPYPVFTWHFTEGMNAE